MNSQEILVIIALLTPLILIQIGLAIYALLDLSRRRAVRGTRSLWAIALTVTALGFPTGIVVSAIYLAWGRNVED